jgi:hypothetical protein
MSPDWGEGDGSWCYLRIRGGILVYFSSMYMYTHSTRTLKICKCIKDEVSSRKDKKNLRYLLHFYTLKQVNTVRF